MNRALLALALLLPASACGWGTYAESAIGHVKDVEGKPRVIRGDRYLELGPGSVIEIRDSLIMGSFDKAEVKLRDETIISTGGDTQLTIQEYVYRERPAKLRLTSFGGRYGLKTGKSFKAAASNLEIDTPFAMIFSGKADLLVEHDVDAASMNVMQLGSDSIRITNQFGEAELLHKGEASTVRFGLLPSPPVQLGERELRDAVESPLLLIDP